MKTAVRQRTVLFPLVLCLLTLTSALPGADENPPAVRGVIDLRGIDFAQAEPVRLDGEWEFHWNILVDTGDWTGFLDRRPDLYTDVPSYWDDLVGSDTRVTPQGVATYRLTILTDPQVNELALKFLNITPNASVHINGRAVAEIGLVHSDRKISRSGNRIQIIPVRADGEPIVLAVTISNYHNINGGLNRPVMIGNYESIRRVRERHLTLDALFLGGLLLMGLYQLALYLLEPRRRATIFMSILCLLAFFFSGFKNEMALLSILPGWDGEIRTKFIYLALTLSAPTFTLYAYNLYPVHFRKGFNWFVLGVSLVFALLILVTRKAFYTPFLIPMEILVFVSAAYTVVMLIRGYRKTRQGAILLYLSGLAFLLISIVFGVVDNERTFVFQSAAAVFFVFILYQAYLQAYIFSSAFHQIDHLSQEKSKLEKRNVELFSLTYIDNLTDTCNRRLMDDFLASTWRVNALTGRNVGLILLDIDDFNSYNEIYGRRQGDHCLVRVSELIRNELAAAGQDTLARYGGEEFAVILSDTDEMTIFRRAESLREAVESGGIEHRRSRISNVVTISVGCACMTPSMDEEPEAVLDAAGKALLRAKRNGRNRVELYSGDDESMAAGTLR